MAKAMLATPVQYCVILHHNKAPLYSGCTCTVQTVAYEMGLVDLVIEAMLT